MDERPAGRHPVSCDPADGREQGSVPARGDGPDFLCVGLQKAGTGWLYDQLRSHPDFAMPHKEMHYFGQDFPDRSLLRKARRHLKEARDRPPPETPTGRMEEDFFRQVTEHWGDRPSVEAYARLFRMKGDRISGDITPGYGLLEPKIVRKLARRFEDMRVLIMLRDPAARLWSQWRMKHDRQERIRARGQETVFDFADTDEDFARFAHDPVAIERSFPSEIAQRWRAPFGARLRVFFLDDVAVNPDAVRRDVVAFLGGDPAKPFGVEADHNRKARAATPERSAAVRAVMKELFEEERAICARTFGGAAEQWPSLPY